MSQEKQPDQLNRREMLKWLGKRGLETGAFFAGINIAFAIRDISQNPKTEKTYAQDTQAVESGHATQVKYFAGDILNTSQEIIGYQPDQNVIESLIGFFGGNTLIGYILKNQSSLINRAVGSISVVPARLLDSLSTIAATRYIQDPRFQEYGFGDYIGERNGVFPDAISSADVFNLNLITNPILLAGGWIAPPLGRGYLGASTLVAKK